jgi:hypothetical protein
MILDWIHVDQDWVRCLGIQNTVIKLSFPHKVRNFLPVDRIWASWDMESQGGINVTRTRRNLILYLHFLRLFYERCLLCVLILGILNSCKHNIKQIPRKIVTSVLCLIPSEVGLHERCEFWGYRGGRWNCIIIWDVTQCKLLEIYQRLEKPVPPSSGHYSVQKTD